MLLHELIDARCPFRILQINHVGNAATLVLQATDFASASFIHATIM